MDDYMVMAQILVGFLIGFVLGCLAADMALKKKTGHGIQYYLPAGKPDYAKTTDSIKDKD